VTFYIRASSNIVGLRELITENNTVHIFDNQKRIAMVETGERFPVDTAPRVRYEMGDHLGSGNVVLDSSGALFNRRGIHALWRDELGRLREGNGFVSVVENG